MRICRLHFCSAHFIFGKIRYKALDTFFRLIRSFVRWAVPSSTDEKNAGYNRNEFRRPNRPNDFFAFYLVCCSTLATKFSKTVVFRNYITIADLFLQSRLPFSLLLFSFPPSSRSLFGPKMSSFLPICLFQCKHFRCTIFSLFFVFVLVFFF